MAKYQYILIFLLINPSLFSKEKSSNSNPITTSKIQEAFYQNAPFENIDKKFDAAKKEVANAKRTKNWNLITLAYKNLIYYVPKEKLLIYTDSMLNAAKKSKDNLLIGSAYLKKGIIYYDRKELEKALDNYIIANSFLVLTKDEYSIYKLKYSIAHTKYYLGFYDEAIALFKECIVFFINENDRAYLNSLHSLGLCYNKIGRYDLCSNINKLGLQKGIEFENREMEHYFIHSEGINQYALKKYPEAIKKLTSSLTLISEKKDFGNHTVANFYIAKSYWAMNKNELAFPYLIKVDDAITNQNYARPDLRENYELLIKFYKTKRDHKQQLHYIEKLLNTDSILDHNYKYLSTKIFKEYDTVKLKTEKQQIEQEMNFKYKVYSAIIALLILFSGYLIYRHRKNKEFFKKKFDELMDENNKEEKPLVKNNQSEELDIKPELITIILKNLEKFEQTNKFLNKDMSIAKIAAALHTNTKYTAKIILKYRDKKSIDYINDLKIDYIVERLKKEKKFRLYTNKALAEEAGFGSTQNFTKAFNKRTDISPTYFINELNKVD